MLTDEQNLVRKLSPMNERLEALCQFERKKLGAVAETTRSYSLGHLWLDQTVLCLKWSSTQPSLCQFSTEPTSAKVF